MLLSTFMHRFFFRLMFSVLLGIWLSVDFLGHMVILFWNCQNISHIQCIWVPITLYSHCLLLSVSILICISVMTKDIEHLFVYLLAICLSLKNPLFRSFAYFYLDYLSLCCWVGVVGVICRFWILVLYHICALKYCISLCGLSFHFLDTVT